MIHKKLKNIINFAPQKIDEIKKINNFFFSKDPAEYLIFIKAIKYYEEKKYDSALFEFKKIEKKIEDKSYPNFKIGMCYFKKGNWANAIHYFEKAKMTKGFKESWDIQYHAAKKNYKSKKVNINNLKDIYYYKKDINSLYDYAVGLKTNKSYWIAIHEINNFSENNHLNEDLKFLLVDCYEKLTDHEKAIEILSDLISVDPKNSNYHYRMGFNLESIGSNDYVKYYEEFIFLNEYDQDQLYYLMADINAKRGILDNAIKLYCKHEQEFKKDLDSDFYVKRAKIYIKILEWKKAISDLEKSLNLMNYKDSETLTLCGKCYEKIENYEKAAIFYKEAIKKSNNFDENLYYRCAFSLEKKGLLSEALEYYSAIKNHTSLFFENQKFDNEEHKKLAFYSSYYEGLKIIENEILIESFLGNNFSCNPLAITKKLLNDEKFDNFTFYIVLDDIEKLNKNVFDDRIVVLKRESNLYLRKLASVKYLINNVSFPYYFIRKEGQLYLNTWHGTPLKTLGKDIKNPLMDHANVSRNFLHTTHIISQNNFTNQILLEKYDIKNIYSGKMAETGYPRVDSTLNIKLDIKENIFNKLGVDGKKPIILYAPTWRGTSISKKFNTDKLLQDLEDLQSSEYDLIFKCHHFAEKVIRESCLNVNIVDSDIDINELLGCIDILISDYSSVVFDFVKTQKPIISYIYDYDEYVEERGLYVDKNSLLGFKANDIDTLKKYIADNLHCTMDYPDHILEMVRQDDGYATQKVIDFFFYEDETNLYNYEKKPVHLLYTGPYLPNGILKSFTNLIENLKKNSDDEYCVVFNRQDVLAHSDRKNEFLKNNRDDVSYIPRVGSMPMMSEEVWVREKFENTFEIYSESFNEVYLKIFKREARRLFGDSKFKSVVNFEGYSLFWSALLSQVKSENKVIFQHNDLYSEWKSKYPYLKGVFNMYKNYNHIISVSELTMENNRCKLSPIFNIEEDKFKFSNNTILIEEIESKSYLKNELLSVFSEFKGRKVVNIGRLSHEKDQEKLIKAFKLSNLKDKNCKLYILGQGYLRDHLDNLIKDLNLEDYVYLLGQVENPYVYIKNADLFVLSSNHEGQPMVLLEALTLGTPILASDIVGNRSILKEYEYYLFENDQEVLAEKLKNYDFNIKVKNNFNASDYNNQSIEKIISILN